MKLSELKVGQKAMITKINCENKLKRRLLEMGLIPKTVVKINKLAPLLDPIEIQVFDYVLTLRLEEADKIEVNYVK